MWESALSTTMVSGMGAKIEEKGNACQVSDMRSREQGAEGRVQTWHGMAASEDGLWKEGVEKKERRERPSSAPGDRQGPECRLHTLNAGRFRLYFFVRVEFAGIGSRRRRSIALEK